VGGVGLSLVFTLVLIPALLRMRRPTPVAERSEPVVVQRRLEPAA
jgi:hypothetical protein